MNILSIEHLTRVYGTGDTAVTALNDVSFTVEAGEFIAIIGSSGSGKSTLMHLMGGVDRPTSGTVRLQGQDIFARNDEQLAVFRRREVGLIYQFYNLIPVLNVVENMTLPVLMDGRSVNEQAYRPSCGRWASRAASTACPISSPAASSSASPLAAHS